MSDFSNAQNILVALSNRQVRLSPRDQQTVENGDQTILLSGQVGGHLHIQAWLQDSYEGIPELVRVHAFVTPTHKDPTDRIDGDFDEDGILVTRQDFNQALQTALFLQSVW